MHSQDTFINPGVKFAIDLNTKETIYGIEISIVRSTNVLKYGIGSSINLDYFTSQNKYKLFVGCQANYHVFGISLGPAIMFDKENKYGFSVIPYAGAVFIPYFNYTYSFNSSDLQETGMFIKIPVLITGGTSWYPLRR